MELPCLDHSAAPASNLIEIIAKINNPTKCEVRAVIHLIMTINNSTTKTTNKFVIFMDQMLCVMIRCKNSVICFKKAGQIIHGEDCSGHLQDCSGDYNDLLEM